MGQVIDIDYSGVPVQTSVNSTLLYIQNFSLMGFICSLIFSHSVFYLVCMFWSVDHKNDNIIHSPYIVFLQNSAKERDGTQDNTS